MAANIITTEDLQNFKQEILTEIQKLFSQKMETVNRKWLKSSEVKKLLMISPGTLQHLRLNGSLPFTKIGGTIFYEYSDIQRMIDRHKQNIQ